MLQRSRAPERFTFGLENLKAVNVTSSQGATMASTYTYDSTSPERVTSVSVQGAAIGDLYNYDVRGRGLVTQHLLSASQSPAQDSYEYDSRGRLVSIAHLGTVQETLGYDGAGDLASRTFAHGGTELARYYIGDDLTLVDRGGAGNVGYAHIRLGGARIASVYAKSGTQPTVIYYHRDRGNDVVATTTSGGVMGLSYRYLPSGAIDKVIGPSGSPATETDTTGSELGFIGGLKLSGGLIHLRARAYSPALRRFLQPDTIDRRRYTYAFGDPVNFTDPSGRAPGQKVPVPTVTTSGTGDGGCGSCYSGFEKGLMGIVNGIATLGGWIANGASAIGDAIQSLPGGDGAPTFTPGQNSSPWGAAMPAAGAGSSTIAAVAGLKTGAQSIISYVTSPTSVQAATVATAVVAMVFLGRSNPTVDAAAAEVRDELVTVMHFTNPETAEAIESSGELRAGTFVTLPSQVQGLSSSSAVEEALEIVPGRGAMVTTFQTYFSNLLTPYNGPVTSGGAIQYQLANPVPLPPGSFTPWP